MTATLLSLLVISAPTGEFVTPAWRPEYALDLHPEGRIDGFRLSLTALNDLTRGNDVSSQVVLAARYAVLPWLETVASLSSAGTFGDPQYPLLEHAALGARAWTGKAGDRLRFGGLFDVAVGAAIGDDTEGFSVATDTRVAIAYASGPLRLYGDLGIGTGMVENRERDGHVAAGLAQVGAGYALTDSFEASLSALATYTPGRSDSERFQTTLAGAYDFGSGTRAYLGLVLAQREFDGGAMSLGGTGGLTFGFAETDRDNDGLVDSADACPSKPGTRELQGCPFEDADNDGVYDPHDACPGVAGDASHGGCPILDRNNDGKPDAEEICDRPGFDCR